MARVLIVDDANIIRVHLGRLMEKLGHKVVGEAQDGYGAIQQYKILKPDLVTMDITMPDVNGVSGGIDAVKQIILYDPKAKIIMVTSHGDKKKVLDSLRCGASNYLLKPIDPIRMKKVVEELLS